MLLTDDLTIFYVLVLNRHNVGSNAQSKVYARVTNDPGLLRRAMNDINGAFPFTYCRPPMQASYTTNNNNLD